MPFAVYIIIGALCGIIVVLISKVQKLKKEKTDEEKDVEKIKRDT